MKKLSFSTIIITIIILLYLLSGCCSITVEKDGVKATYIRFLSQEISNFEIQTNDYIIKFDKQKSDNEIMFDIFQQQIGVK